MTPSAMAFISSVFSPGSFPQLMFRTHLKFTRDAHSIRAPGISSATWLLLVQVTRSPVVAVESSLWTARAPLFRGRPPSAGSPLIPRCCCPSGLLPMRQAPHPRSCARGEQMSEEPAPRGEGGGEHARCAPLQREARGRHSIARFRPRRIQLSRFFSGRERVVIVSLASLKLAHRQV